MRYCALVILSAFMVAVETTVIPYICIGGIGPDVIGTFVALVSMLSGRPIGLFVAVVAGLLEDMSSGQYLGLFTLVRLAIACLAGASYQKVFQEWAVVPIIIVFVTGFVGGCLQVFLLASFGVPFESYRVALSAVVLQAAYSALLSPLVMRITCSVDSYVSYVSERRKSLQP
jgi:rod shape-determining protein MreD